MTEAVRKVDRRQLADDRKKMAVDHWPMAERKTRVAFFRAVILIEARLVFKFKTVCASIEISPDKREVRRLFLK